MQMITKPFLQICLHLNGTRRRVALVKLNGTSVRAGKRQFCLRRTRTVESESSPERQRQAGRRSSDLPPRRQVRRKLSDQLHRGDLRRLSSTESDVRHRRRQGLPGDDQPRRRRRSALQAVCQQARLRQARLIAVRHDQRLRLPRSLRSQRSHLHPVGSRLR